MNELIKREDAIKITWIEPQYSDPINVLTEVRDRIKALPTVDAVPVVRCKDCKYFGEYCDEYKEESQTDGMCDLYIKDSTTFDWFCADGERR